MRRTLGVLGVLGAVTLFPSAAGAVRFSAADGIRVASTHRLDSRLIALTVRTSALPGPANVRVLLPRGYASSPDRRYPVLYLLHGTVGGAADWTTQGRAEQITAGRPLIVVMPDIGSNYDGGGWCANWFNGGAGGRPRWETFHIDELIPWIDHNLRTVANRGGRAVAGLSQGGFCSMSYAARHPDVFGVALSFSGAPDIALDPVARQLTTPAVTDAETALDHVPAGSIFGPRSTQELNWAAHDPTTLAPNLRGMKLLMFTGNGQAGPLDRSPTSLSSTIEAGVQVLTRLFHDRLRSLGIASRFDDYGPGTHAWPYWNRDLRQSIGPIMAAFAHPTRAPRQVTYTSASPSYSVFGWRVSLHRHVAEFSTLTRAGIRGFELMGSGSATVTTPARYQPGGWYRVTVQSRSGAHFGLQQALRSGRLRISVPLGPSNTVQQYAPGSTTAVFQTRVQIARDR